VTKDDLKAFGSSLVSPLRTNEGSASEDSTSSSSHTFPFGVVLEVYEAVRTKVQEMEEDDPRTLPTRKQLEAQPVLTH
jgi:hypothetical protein